MSAPIRRLAVAGAAVAAALAYAPIRRALKPKELIDALSVVGVATLDGTPMASGCVAFLPETPEEAGGRAGLARIEPDGTFRIGNANPGRPIKMKPGAYRITVLAMDASGPVPALVSPPRYADRRATPLRATLELGANRVDLSLRR